MSALQLPDDHEPLFYLGDFPVRLISLLVALHCATMVAASLLLASGHGVVLDLLSFSSVAVAHGQIWRLVTYAFVATPSVWFLFEMVMLYYFGREVENGLGWKRFGILYAGLILIGPLLLQALGSGGNPQSFVGAQQVNFAVFAAFVAIHPGPSSSSGWPHDGFFSDCSPSLPSSTWLTINRRRYWFLFPRVFLRSCS